ncbi:cytochrome P450 [Boletus coccyginus]|nr:cytochrome P450 [Boletus coccyginus]
MGVHILDVVLAGLALNIVGRLVWGRTRSAPLPPGPPGWPLIDNLLEFREPALYKSFGAMSSEYGPIISLRSMGMQLVVLNCLKATKDLLGKKSTVTSNRMHFTLAFDLVGWGGATGFLQYGDAHRKHRKFFQRHIGTKKSLVTFYPVEEVEAKQFVRNVLKDPDDLVAHCHRLAASLILRFSHGYIVKDDGDSLVEIADRAMHTITDTMIPGHFLVDVLPILRYLPEWFPGGGFHKDVKRWRKLVSEAVDTPHKFVLDHLGDALPSFTSQLLQEGIAPEDEEILKWASVSMYLGGTETTPTMVTAFFLAMTIYPEVFKKAQAEVDAVVGDKRLPTNEDRGALPYVNAICMELFRWNVLIPLPGHVTTEDIIYEGYFIPQGTCLLPNIWFILSNPETYPNPDVFDPERFLGEHQQPDPRQACFGWGRRLCLGARLAESTIFINVAMVAATLNVSRCVENGVECVPRYEYDEGMIRHIKPFKCRIVPRSKEAEDLLHASSE